MPFEGGIKAAAAMLAGLNPEERVKVLSRIAERDPQMAEQLKKNMVTFEDLQYITQKMLVELMREISLDDLALGLRLGSDELKNFILSNVSKTIKQDIEDILNGKPQQKNIVLESQENIMKIVRAKLDKGELVFSKDGTGEEYV
jgi:flagellar motor switch protein FliG